MPLTEQVMKIIPGQPVVFRPRTTLATPARVIGSAFNYTTRQTCVVLGFRDVTDLVVLNLEQFARLCEAVVEEKPEVANA